MATINYWIQIENRPWDVCPKNIDRITGQNLKDREGKDPELDVQLTSLGTPVHTRKTTMFRPLRDDAGKVRDALILRRYKPPQQPDESDAWTVPDDRKINPWDLNEPDPTDTGTMGTIPGPVIECSVGDDVFVHFRNKDQRGSVVLDKICFPFPFIGEVCLPFPKFVPLPVERRTHSLHPHGFVFAPQHDGAFPLSPPDPAQPIPASQAAAWASVPGFSGSLKKGDRVPPEGTFTYRWNTFGWPTTAGVWLYHDHSICDMENTESGAIGFIVIHNPADINNEVDIRLPADQQDTAGTALDPQFLPGGSPIGSPRHLVCFPFPRGLGAQVLPHDLDGLGDLGDAVHEHGAMPDPAAPVDEHAPEEEKATKVGPPVLARAIRRGDLVFELNKNLEKFIRLCHLEYRKPPEKALYLQLFHTMGDVGMCINGRKYLGNTPTMVAGPHTRMRFGVVGMGSDFHTFHIHGHRWALPGPHGNNPGAIQGSAQDTPVSQFEDTRTFGPANSFVFTIEEGSGFMRADPFTPGSPVGEWHMHCHVLMHMDQGMMGSLLVVNENGGPALPLPKGVPCEMPKMGGGGGGGGGQTQTVVVKNFAFTPATLNVHVGDQVVFDFQEASHTVHTLSAVNATGIEINNGNSTTAVIPIPTQRPVTIAGTAGGHINYECGIHHAPMTGTINII